MAYRYYNSSWTGKKSSSTSSMSISTFFFISSDKITLGLPSLNSGRSLKRDSGIGSYSASSRITGSTGGAGFTVASVGAVSKTPRKRRRTRSTRMRNLEKYSHDGVQVFSQTLTHPSRAHRSRNAPEHQRSV